MEALPEILTAATAYVLVRKREWWDRRNLAPELDNFQFYSTQCGFWDGTPRQLLSAAVEFGLYLAFGWGLWIAIPVGYATSRAVPFLYSLVRNGAIYFFAVTREPIRLDDTEVDDSFATGDEEENQLVTDRRTPLPETFRHRPLSGPDDFRCLLLKSAKDKDAIIQCELYHLGTDTPAFYDAVSYCWEGQAPTEPILCDNQIFLVTANCMALLKHLRRRWVGRLLWVDAICIDQTKEREQERNQQLQIMGQIYSRATNVLIWLGPSTPESRLAFRYLRFLQEMMVFPQSVQDWVRMRLLKKIVARKHANCIRETSRRPWYSRVWTVQEVAMAKQGCCKVYCGEDKLNYDWMNLHLSSMTTGLHLRDDYCLNDLLQDNRNRLRRALRHEVVDKKENPPKGMVFLMRYLLCYQSTNPADKIFAFYGILKEIGIVMPVPDYGFSLEMVYWTATLALLMEEPCTSLLPIASGVDSKLSEAPTWVPDFRMTNHMMFSDGKFRASGTSLPRLEIIGDWHALKVAGKIIDKIVDKSMDAFGVWEPPFGSPAVIDSRYFGLDDNNIFTPTIMVLQDFIGFSFDLNTNLRYLREVDYDIYQILGDIYTQGRMALIGLDEYDFAVWLEILMANKPWFPHTKDESLQIYMQKAREDPQMRRRFLDNPRLQPLTEFDEWKILCAMKMNPNSARMMHLVWAVNRGNMLFSTRERYLGSASRSLIVGDEIALIQGVKTPMVLRPVETASGKRYQVVGPAYVYGVMDGELWDESMSGIEDLILI